MGKKIEFDLIANTGQAVEKVEELKGSVEELNKQKERSNELDKEAQTTTANSSKVIRLFDQITGGAVTRIKAFVEGIKALIVETRALTAAQIKANIVALANPYVLAGAAIAATAGSLALLVKTSKDEGVPALTTLKNLFLSLGDAAKFARLQAEAATKGSKFINDEEIRKAERAMAILSAQGKSTIDLEIEIQKRRLSLMKEGEEGYYEEQTKLMALRAKRSRESGEAQAKAEEEGRQAKLKEIQEQEQFEADQLSLSKQQDEYDKGYLEGEAYLAGKRAIFGEIKEDEPYFSYLDPNKDPELDPELQYSIAVNDAKLAIEKEHSEKIKAARKDLFLNLVSIFGAETKLGKAMLIAKQIQTAAEIAQEIKKTITFNAQSAARTTQSAAEALAQGTIATAQGAAETAKVGFPQNVPLLIAYAAQAAGIIMAIKQATAGIPTVQQAFVPASPGVSPGFVNTLPNVSPVGRDGTSQLAEAIQGQQQRPIRAYVVSSDVTSAQSLDRNIVEGASI